MQSLITRAASVVAVAALALLGGAMDAQARTEIRLWHAQTGAGGEALAALVEQFNQSQGEFEVKAVYKGTYTEVLASTMSAYRQKSHPHIAQIYEIGTLSMILSGAIVPIQRLMKQQEIAVDWADFIEAVTGYYSKGGILYSMPFNPSTPILFYNRDIFKKAGLGETPPVTWADVETVSRKILAAGAAKCGFTTPGPSWTMLENTFAWHNQPIAINQNGYTGLDTKLLINSDFGLMHIGALARWQKENIFFSSGPLGQPDRFSTGDCAMMVDSSSAIPRYKETLKFDWRTGQLPHWGPPYPKQNTLIGGASLWVLRGHGSADYKGVAQFMKFISEPQQQMRVVAIAGWLPRTKTAVKNLEDGGFYKQNPEQWTAISQLLNVTPTSNSRGIRLGNFAQIREAIESEAERIFAGKKTAREGLDDAVTKGNAILRQFGVSHSAAASGEI